MKKILPLVLLIALIGSCTFRQEVNFSKNWSGDMVCVIDMSEMATLLESTGDPADIMEDENSKSKIAQLKNIPGIKKVKMKETDKRNLPDYLQFQGPHRAEQIRKRTFFRCKRTARFQLFPAEG